MIPIDNKSEGAVQLWKHGVEERLDLKPGVNKVDEADFAKFKDEIIAHDALVPVEELNDIPVAKKEPAKEDKKQASKKEEVLEKINE